jgi:hypothetical protein
MMRFSAVLQLPVQTSRKILQSDGGHIGTVTVPFWLSTRLWRAEDGLCLSLVSTGRRLSLGLFGRNCADERSDYVRLHPLI